MTPDLRRMVAEALEHSTPGPWASYWRGEYIVPADHVTKHIGMSIYPEDDKARFAQIIAKCVDDDHGRGSREANAALIVAAVNSMPAYLAQADTIAGLRAENAELRKQKEHSQQQWRQQTARVDVLTAALRTAREALRKSMIEPYESGNVDCWHCHVCDTKWDRISGERHAPNCPAATESNP